jgi:hypothetical protein
MYVGVCGIIMIYVGKYGQMIYVGDCEQKIICGLIVIYIGECGQMMVYIGKCGQIIIYM